MIEKGVHKCMWDLGFRYTAEIAQISEWFDCDFYDLVWYYDQKHPDMTDNDQSFAYGLGVSSCYRSDLSYWVLLKSGILISRTSVQHVTQKNMHNQVIFGAVENMKVVLDKRLLEDNFHNQYDGEYFDNVKKVLSK
jgi:hypothetical protein